MSSCIFCKIRERQIPAKFIYENDAVMVFPDIHPVKPVHLLIVPKEHIEDFLSVENDEVLGKLRVVVQKMIKEKGLDGKGYKLSINGGGAQLINHLHIHLMGPMGKMAAM